MSKRVSHRNIIDSVDLVTRLFAARELKALPRVLQPGEWAKHLMYGICTDRTGILCATNFRLLFVYCGFLQGSGVKAVDYGHIGEFEFHPGFLQARVVIHAAGCEIQVTNLDKDRGRELAEYVTHRLAMNCDEPCSPVSTTAHHDSAPENHLAALERLAKLKEQGILTEEEFRAEKQWILNTLPPASEAHSHPLVEPVARGTPSGNVLFVNQSESETGLTSRPGRPQRARGHALARTGRKVSPHPSPVQSRPLPPPTQPTRSRSTGGLIVRWGEFFLRYTWRKARHN